MKRISRGMMALAALAIAVGATSARAQQTPADKAQAMVDKGLAFLKTKQNADGSFGPAQMPPAITALILRGMVQDKNHPYSSPEVQNGYHFLIGKQKPDGGIYVDMLENYNTAIAMSALAAAKDQPEVKTALDKAVEYMKGTQWKADMKGPKGQDLNDPKFVAWQGGFSYNPKHDRPDLSNVHFSLQALYDAGLKPDDPAFKEAQKFITRTQNRSESNDQPWAGNDGGFVYSPANGGDSEAESYTSPDGQKRWRSYGTMTYAGLKSMIYAGISKTDPRVTAAVDWCRANWTLDENPGLRLNDPKQAQHGLYYYYHVMAKALHAYDEPVITDTAGKAHDWRVELIDKIASLQKPDGSWSGETRWMENLPILSTSYVVLALEETQKSLAAHPPKGQW